VLPRWNTLQRSGTRRRISSGDSTLMRFEKSVLNIRSLSAWIQPR
jgi:hypothetical protein